MCGKEKKKGENAIRTVDNVPNEGDTAGENSDGNKKYPAQRVDDDKKALHAQREETDNGSRHRVVECCWKGGDIVSIIETVREDSNAPM
jgi:hypothetical protein